MQLANPSGKFMSQRYVCMKELMHVTLQKASDTGPSFSEAVNSCTTFSRPLLMACISSAKYFNCIYIIGNLAQSCHMYKEFIVPKKIKREKDTIPLLKPLNLQGLSENQEVLAAFPQAPMVCWR